MMFAGGPLGTGRQWFSWIHLDDLVNLIYESLINPSYKGDLTTTTAHSLISLFYMNSIAHWINSSSILVI